MMAEKRDKSVTTVVETFRAPSLQRARPPQSLRCQIHGVPMMIERGNSLFCYRCLGLETPMQHDMAPVYSYLSMRKGRAKTFKTTRL